MMALAIVFCMVFISAGLVVSYQLDVPSGSMIIPHRRRSLFARRAGEVSTKTLIRPSFSASACEDVKSTPLATNQDGRRHHSQATFSFQTANSLQRVAIKKTSFAWRQKACRRRKSHQPGRWRRLCR